MQALQNLYGFLSQVIPYQDSDVERLYVFLRHLAAKLPRRKSGPVYQFDDEVRLEYYRLQKISEGSITLKDGEARKLDGPAEVGSGVLREQPVPLSQLIDIVNERFGTDFTPFEHTDENVLTCFDAMQRHWEQRADGEMLERKVGRPSQVRERMKLELRPVLEAPELHGARRGAGPVPRVHGGCTARVRTAATVIPRW